MASTYKHVSFLNHTLELRNWIPFCRSGWMRISSIQRTWNVSGWPTASLSQATVVWRPAEKTENALSGILPFGVPGSWSLSSGCCRFSRWGSNSVLVAGWEGCFPEECGPVPGSRMPILLLVCRSWMRQPAVNWSRTPLWPLHAAFWKAFMPGGGT